MLLCIFLLCHVMLVQEVVPVSYLVNSTSLQDCIFSENMLFPTILAIACLFSTVSLNDDVVRKKLIRRKKNWNFSEYNENEPSLREIGPVKVLKRKIIRTGSKEPQKQIIKRKIVSHPQNLQVEKQNYSPVQSFYANQSISEPIPTKPTDAKRCE